MSICLNPDCETPYCKGCTRTDEQMKALDHCSACGGDGILHVSVDGAEPPEGMRYIQRCDTCNRYADDFEAAANSGREILAVLVREP